MTGQRQPIEHPVELALPFGVFVDGDPAPKGSVQRNATRGVRHTKRSIGWHDVLVDALKLKIRNDRMAELLRGLDRPLPPAPLARDVAVHAEFVLRQPRSNRDTAPHAKRHGDLDKHLRTLFDALTDAGVLADDSFVTEVHTSKRWAAPTERCGVRVQVTETFGELLARVFDVPLDEFGFVPMADPRGLLNVAGIAPLPAAVEAERTYYEDVMRARETMLANPGVRSAADLTRIVPSDSNELSDDGGR